MQKLVDYHEKHPKHKLKTIQKRCSRKLKSMENLRNYRKYVENNGNSRQHWKRIDDYVFNRYTASRDQYLPVHTIDLMRWAQDYCRQNNFKFKSR